MPIKFKNKNMGVIKGDIPLKSIMVGTNCVYGFDFAAFKISYPSVSGGTGFYIDVNGSRKINKPATAGSLDVHFGDRIVVKTYAEIGYENPVSSVVASGDPITGTDYAITIDGVSVKRSTTYSFTVRGDGSITVADAVPARKVNINIDKDAGIGNVSLFYTKGPYEYSGLNNSALETTEIKLTTENTAIQMYLYNKISQREPTAIAEEGFKLVSTTKNFTGLLTSDNQCTIRAVALAGIKVSIVCPPITSGITNYSLYLVSSEYSRNVSQYPAFYNQSLSAPSQTSVEISKRNNDQYYFYKGDKIRISAVRKEGFKRPSLGIQGDISPQVTTKDIVLSDANVLVIQSGEQGIPVQLINEPLETKELAYLNLTSEYTDNKNMVLSPNIYVGDTITVPLLPNYRVGTRTHRKPAVGFSADGNVIAAPTFTAVATVQVPNCSILTVNLQQGAERIRTGQYTIAPVATFSRLTNISPMSITYRSVSSDSFTPVPNYGPEEFFLDSFDLSYSCKRYWLDAITSKYNKITQNNVPSSFSYTYDCDIFATKVVIAGTYKIDENGKGVKMTVSEYDTDWVANSSDQAKLIPSVIRI